jgi:AAA family ATP:ADP antiporter
MTSKEALRLAASMRPEPSDSTALSNQTNDWNTMDTAMSSSIEEHLIASVEAATVTDFEESLLRSQTKDEFPTHNAKIKRKRMSRNKYNTEDDNEDDQDEFFDVPLAHSSHSRSKHLMDRLISWGIQVSKQMYRRVYSDKLPVSEFRRTLCLSMTLFFMIGGYWLLRSVKDPVLTALCGVTAIPKAKMLSVFVVLAIVSVYNRLLDSPNISKHSLFYYFGTFYFILFIAISYFLNHPTIGLPNQIPSTRRILGWISYCAIESFGSVMVALFWSFTNSNFHLESAKASFGLLTATAQLGSILGPTVVNVYATRLGVPFCYAVGACCMLLLQLSMYMYVSLYGTHETNHTSTSPLKEEKAKSQQAGIFEGLHLFVKYSYVKGLFAISCLFMVEITIIDYTLKVLARDHFDQIFPCSPNSSCWDASINAPQGMSLDATEAFTKFMGLFGQATNILSFILSFFGTSIVIRKFGLRLTLLLFPCLCLAVIVMVRLYPTLYVVFAAMMILKASTYAFNNPTKEILYQPTSSAVKYKAKSWIDIFGARGSKALGSVVTNAFSDSTTSLIHNGSLVGMMVAGYLIWNARFMGERFDEYIETGHIVGDDKNGGQNETAHVVPILRNESSCDFSSSNGLELEMIPNNEIDTSCATLEEDNQVGEVSDEKDGQAKEKPSKIEFV